MKNTRWLALLITMLFSPSLLTSAAMSSQAVASIPSNPSNNLILLIDELNCESIAESKISAITLLLKRAILEQTAPILVSRNILYNYVARRSFTTHASHPENKIFATSPFYQETWRLFKITGTAYYLLIPEAYLIAKGITLPLFPRHSNPRLGLHFHMMRELSLMLPVSGDFYRDLRTFLRDDKDSATLALIDLSQIFITHSDVHGSSPCVWIFYMGGHGSPKNCTVGTNIATIQKLLAFFNTHLTTRVVYINSCFLGGQVKEMLVSGIDKPYNFVLTIGSITDSIVVVHSDNMSFKSFFSELDTFSTPHREDLLAHACGHLAPCIESTWSSHGVSSIPQVCLGKTFRILDTHGTVATLERHGPSPEHLKDTTTACSFSDVKDPAIPIHPENKIVIPLYRSSYQDLIHVSPAICVTKYPSQQSPLSFIPAAETLLSAKAFSTPEQSVILFGSGHALLDPFLVVDKTAEQNYKTVLQHLSPPMALFPLFISMLHETDSATTTGTVHHFANIVALNEIGGVKTPFFGLLRFFRDAFLDASHRASKNVFLIDRLTGFNDFALFATLFQQANKLLFSTIDLIFSFHANKTITLEHVIVITQGRLGLCGNEMNVSISFTFCDRSWHLQFSGPPQNFTATCPWIFTREAITPYTEHYDRCVTTDLLDYKHKPKTYADAARRY